MSYRVVFSPEAEQQLTALYRYIAAAGALRCCESLVWQRHTARFAPSIASRIRRPNAQLIPERALSGRPPSYRVPDVFLVFPPTPI